MEKIHFLAQAVGIDWIDDDILAIVFADDPEEPDDYLELQRSFAEPDEQDIALGMDTYCISTAAGATTYGGITSFVIRGNQCTIDLAASAAAEIGIAQYQIELNLTADDRPMLYEHIRQLFQAAPSAPQTLLLE
ncbi:Imm10 family immunity protein [Herpetosiphon llansteffanensis]